MSTRVVLLALALIAFPSPSVLAQPPQRPGAPPAAQPAEQDRQRPVQHETAGPNEEKVSQTSHTMRLWGTDEWSGGGRCCFAPGQFPSAFPLAQQPEGRVHFPGEHTSAWVGMLNAAVESGTRAAREIQARV
jgi:monoamine oxidase